MGNLPKEQNRKQTPGLKRQAPPGRGPACHGRQGPWNRTEKSTEGGLALKRRVEEEIAHHADRRNETAEWVDQKRESEQPTGGNRHSKGQRLGGLQPSIGQGPQARPRHLPIHITLEVLVQGCCSTRRQRHTEKRL